MGGKVRSGLRWVNRQALRLGAGRSTGGRAGRGRRGHERHWLQAGAGQSRSPAGVDESTCETSQPGGACPLNFPACFPWARTLSIYQKARGKMSRHSVTWHAQIKNSPLVPTQSASRVEAHNTFYRDEICFASVSNCYNRNTF